MPKGWIDRIWWQWTAKNYSVNTNDENWDDHWRGPWCVSFVVRKKIKLGLSAIEAEGKNGNIYETKLD